MKRNDAENILIVEGQDDKFAVIGLMEHHCDWPDEPPWPVYVEAAGSDSVILKHGYLSGVIKAATTRRIGVVLDADQGLAEDRYRAMRALCRELFPQLPKQLPATGLLAGNDDGKRLGLWVMPDNQSPGVLEDFLVPLVPSAQSAIWNLADESLGHAIRLGANCGKEQKKARLYTYLAGRMNLGARQALP